MQEYKFPTECSLDIHLLRGDGMLKIESKKNNYLYLFISMIVILIIVITDMILGIEK